MDRHLMQWIAPILATLVVAVDCAVACADPGDIQSQLNALHLALDEAEVTNATVREELDEVRALRSENWLTNQRAASITELVQDVLADSETRLNLQGNRTMFGWSDGFYVASADGRFRLNIGGLMQTRFIAGWVGIRPQGPQQPPDFDPWRYGFELPRIQMTFGGHAFGNGLEYYLETGWGRYDPNGLTADITLMTFRMWEAWVKFRLTSDFAIKAGQFELPFTRESLVRAQYQLAIERSLVDHRMGLGLTHGLEMVWASDDSRFMLAITNGSGALFHSPLWIVPDPTPPTAALNKDTLYSVTMRHEWKLLGDWNQFNQFTSPPGSERGVLVGIAGHRQNTERDSPINDSGFPEGVFWGVTADISMQFDGASAYASVIYERVTDFSPAFTRVNWLAFIAQGSTYVTNQTELYARWETGGPDEEAFGGDELMIVTVGFNHYIDGQDLKFSADIGFSIGDVSLVMLNSQTGWQFDSHKGDQVVVRTQLQMKF